MRKSIGYALGIGAVLAVSSTASANIIRHFEFRFDNPIPIPDNTPGGVRVEIDLGAGVGQPKLIKYLSISLVIEHTWQGDVSVFMEHKDTGVGGFLAPRQVFGKRLRRFCDDSEARGCTLVPPHRYDPKRGYVNAVGSLRIDAALTNFETFSAVGEARFSEWMERPAISTEPPTVTVNAASALAGIDVSAPPPSD